MISGRLLGRVADQLHRIPRPVPLFRLEQLDKDLLLYHPGLTKTILLNDAASMIWQLCDDRRSGWQILALLREAYPESDQQLQGDVEATLQLFADEGAIEFV